MPGRPDPEATRRPLVIRPDMIWPLAIIIALLLVAAINAIFIYVAVSGADDVVPSYYIEDR